MPRRRFLTYRPPGALAALAAALAGVLALLAPAAVRAGDFDARRSEAKAELAAAQKATREAEAKTGQVLMTPLDEAVLASALDRYFDDRERLLQDGIKILADEKPSKEQAERWSRHFREGGARLVQGLAKLTDDDPPTPFVIRFEGIASVESRFWGTVAGFPLAATQGRFVDHRKTFSEERGKLEGKWKEIQSRDDAIDDTMKKLRRELEEIFDRHLREAVQRHEDLVDKLSGWITAAKDADEVTSPEIPSSWLAWLDYLAKSFREMRGRGNAIDGQFRSRYKVEETTVIVFNQTRTAVKSFLDKTNLDKAVEEFEASEKQSLDLAKALPTPGQQADGQRFVERAAKAVDDDLDAFEREFGAFVNQFREVFLGPVGDRTVEALLERREWDDAHGRFLRLNVQSKLKRIYDDNRRLQGISLSGLDDVERKVVEEVLRQDLRALDPLIQEVESMSLLEGGGVMWKLFRDDLITRIKSTSGWVL